jgi:hypothetical protein
VEVGAGNAGLVGKVDHDAAISHKCSIAGDSGDVLVDVAVCCVSGASIGSCVMSNLRGGEALVSGLSVFAREIADLAGSGSRSVAGRSLATDEGVNVSTGGSAVAIGGDGVIMNVVN